MAHTTSFEQIPGNSIPDRDGQKLTPSRPPPFWLLVLLTAASPFAMNALLPLMPLLARVFATDYHVIQLTLTLALVAFGVAQIIIGPVSDRIGRRPVMIAGLVLFVVGSLISALATSTFFLIAGRVIQAIIPGALGGHCAASLRAAAY